MRLKICQAWQEANSGGRRVCEEAAVADFSWFERGIPGGDGLGRLVSAARGAGCCASLIAKVIGHMRNQKGSFAVKMTLR
jgi:hypothetical protein